MLNRIRQYRNQRALTLQEVAAALGISHSQLSRIENGKAPLSHEKAVALAAILKTTVSEIEAGTNLARVVGLIERNGIVRRLRPSDDAQGPAILVPPLAV